jgi:hypothetical protein
MEEQSSKIDDLVVKIKKSYMKLESKVCSVKTSRKLKELGVKQESEFYWRKYSLCKKPKIYHLGDLKRQGVELCILSGSIEYEYSAFTSDELGVMLRRCLKDGQEYPDEEDWQGEFEHCCWAKNEADARAGIIITLLRKKFISSSFDKL